MSEDKLPLTRGDCIDGPRPCPHTRCKFHLIEEPSTGRRTTGEQHAKRVTLRALAGVTETCALDVADRGEHQLNEIAEYLGISAERARQIEELALRKLGRNRTAQEVGK